MRMPAKQARAVDRGAKTTLRIPVDRRITARPLRPAARHSGRPFHPKAGTVLVLHGGEHHPDGHWVTTDTVHATMTTVTRGELGHLTLEQAQQEGYGSVPEFEIGFVERYERDWLNRQDEAARIVRFTEPEIIEARAEWARIRYATTWAPRDVWVIGIRALHDPPYLLPGLPEEPEAIPVDRLARRWDRNAAKRHESAHQEALDEQLSRCRTLEERLAVVRGEASRQGRDIRTHLRAIDRRIEDMLRVLSRDAA